MSPKAVFAHDEPTHRLSSDTYDANGNTLLASGLGLLTSDQYDFEDASPAARLRVRPCSFSMTATASAWPRSSLRPRAP